MLARNILLAFWVVLLWQNDTAVALIASVSRVDSRQNHPDVKPPTSIAKYHDKNDKKNKKEAMINQIQFIFLFGQLY